VPSTKAGQGLVEYVVLLALASLIGVVVVGVAGQQLTDAFNRVSAVVADPAALVATPTPTPTASFAPAPSAEAPAASAISEPSSAPTPAPAPTAAPAPTPDSHPDPAREVDHHGHHGG
jgi:hypothetical protein